MSLKVLNPSVLLRAARLSAGVFSGRRGAPNLHLLFHGSARRWARGAAGSETDERREEGGRSETGEGASEINLGTRCVSASQPSRSCFLKSIAGATHFKAEGERLRSDPPPTKPSAGVAQSMTFEALLPLNRA